jgi:hypothetical protein
VESPEVAEALEVMEQLATDLVTGWRDGVEWRRCIRLSKPSIMRFYSGIP